jgi:signal transduction histidine kinase/ligand-binding sensor domain-containing protein
MGALKKILIPLIFLLATYHIALTQQPGKKQTGNEFRLVHWSSDNGLFYGRVNCFIKDRNGFLWVGTEMALNRFDGSSFKNYLNLQNKNQSTIGHYIISLIEDSLHNIWVGTDKGLSRYDIKEDSFANFLPIPGSSYSSKSIVPFWSTTDKLYCFESDSIVTTYDINSFERKVITRLKRKTGNDEVNSLTVLDVRNNCLWMLPKNDEGGLIKVSLMNGEQLLYNWSSYKNVPHSSHNSEAMCYDRKRNCIWINDMEGLIQFNIDDKKFQYISVLKDYHNRGAAITIDQENRIWVGTGDKGIIIYDPETGSVDLPFGSDPTLQHQANDFNYRIFCDKDGVAWVGYWGHFGKGVNQLIPFSNVFLRYTAQTGKSNALNSTYGGTLAESADGKIWVFVEPDLNILNPATGLFDWMQLKDFSGIHQNNSVSFLGLGRTAQKGWIAGDQSGELFELDITTKQCRPFTIVDTSGHRISFVDFNEEQSLRMGNGSEDLFFGRVPGHGESVFLLNKDSQVVHQLSGFPNGETSVIATDGDHLLFIRRKGISFNQTFTLLNGRLEITPTALDSIGWNNIVFNKADQTWWVGGLMQLIHYDKNFHVIFRYSSDQGLPLINIYGIQVDNLGNIWISTERSISVLDLKTNQIRTLSEKDGWQSQPYHVLGTQAKDEEGNLYFSGYTGLDRISPNRIKINYPPSSVYLRSLEINQLPFQLSPDKETGQQNLNLKYFQNKISIETGIVDFYSMGSSKIRYKLMEHAKSADWQLAPANYIIRFEDLAPGDYKLVMQASNAGNEFNGPEKVLLINISPPWWQTWWARLTFVLAFAFALWKIIQYRSRNLKQRNIVLEEKVMHRTKELKHSMEEQKAMQKQLVHSEKMASLGELTAGIAHEIQNPLNFVNNFSDVNRELLQEMKDEIDKGNIDEVNSLAQDIMENETKINHHGKRADAIVKSMLQHSRSSSVSKEPTEINVLTDEYVRLAYHGLRAKDNSFNSNLQTDYDETTGVINIIPQDIGRVILNLVNNAFYATNERNKQQSDGYDPTVWISTKKINGKVEISVRDNGNGIPQKVLDKIFQPFFTTKPTGQGTGLGLSLSYDIVKAHGGDIRVDTQEGDYTEFVVSLPLS